MHNNCVIRPLAKQPGKICTFNFISVEQKKKSRSVQRKFAAHMVVPDVENRIMNHLIYVAVSWKHRESICSARSKNDIPKRPREQSAKKHIGNNIREPRSF